jgi:hypothetical protein
MITMRPSSTTSRTYIFYIVSDGPNFPEPFRNFAPHAFPRFLKKLRRNSHVALLICTTVGQDFGLSMCDWSVSIVIRACHSPISTHADEFWSRWRVTKKQSLICFDYSYLRQKHTRLLLDSRQNKDARTTSRHTGTKSRDHRLKKRYKSI